MAVNVRLPELTFNVVGGAERFNVTFTVRVRPPPVTVMVPLLVPTIAVVVSMVAFNEPLFDPLYARMVSQLTASDTLQAAFDVIDSD